MRAKILFAFSSCLRHAFMTGAGYGDFDKISDTDQRRWIDYDPSDLQPFKKTDEELDAAEIFRTGLQSIITYIDGDLPVSARAIAADLLAKHGGAE